MLKLGIIGYPLEHSLSPVMHNAALKELGIEGIYEVLETPPEKLYAKVDSLKEQGYRGFNVTIPHKVEIIKFLDSIDSFAKAVGAVNTVLINENGSFNGYNTDVYGFVEAIPAETRVKLRGEKAVVLGSGGAARAVISGLAEIGIKEISIIARNQEKAQKLREIMGGNFSDIEINYIACRDLSEYSIIVNTTPLGMYGENERLSPLSQENIATLPEHSLVYDIIYRPRKTKLLEYAEKRGLKTLDGLEMLVLQGAKAFELWTGKNPPVEIMRDAVAS